MIRAGIALAIVTVAISITFGVRELWVEYTRDLDRIAQFVPSQTMTNPEAVARAARLTGRLMECFGDLPGWQCRPIGRTQSEHPDEIIGPVVTCLDGTCMLSATVVR